MKGRRRGKAGRAPIRVMDFVSTFDTKLTAILQALTHLKHRRCIMVTHSLNAAWKIKDHRTKHSLATFIQYKIETRHEAQLDIVVVWVPSHIGLNDNDRAD